ncbi:hypothetical protein Asp14428_08910 [Actinoplanes sp. NBRC 14428]|nr:hypothetical protein Asp14428_08910 [Actinoplanes sp. NBRC 14428]
MSGVVLVVLDVGLPDADGREVPAVARADGREVPVAMLTVDAPTSRWEW